MRRMLIAVLSGVVMALSLPLGAGAQTTVTATMEDVDPVDQLIHQN